MATRREAREWAMQILFSLDLNPGELETVCAEFWREHTADDASRAFAEELVRGVVSHRAELDASIESYAQNWRIGRMAVTDRNVLRVALYEMLHRPDIPPVVSINEAVDIAKFFNNRESGRFVNGILDRARRELPPRRAGRGGTPAAPPPES